jgi:hypothetical protein
MNDFTVLIGSPTGSYFGEEVTQELANPGTWVQAFESLAEIRHSGCSALDSISLAQVVAVPTEDSGSFVDEVLQQVWHTEITAQGYVCPRRIVFSTELTERESRLQSVMITIWLGTCPTEGMGVNSLAVIEAIMRITIQSQGSMASAMFVEELDEGWENVTTCQFRSIYLQAI